jgi:hypothetical protein
MAGYQCGGGMSGAKMSCTCEGQIKNGIYENSSKWTTWKDHTGTTQQCTDGLWPGEDPAPGQDKYCYCKMATPITGTGESTSVSTSSGSGLEVVTCYEEKLCFDWGNNIVLGQVGSQTSQEGILKLIGSQMLTGFMTQASITGATVKTDMDGYTIDGLIAGAIFRITPASGDMPALVAGLDGLDRQGLFTSTLNTITSILPSGSAEAQMVQGASAYVTIVPSCSIFPSEVSDTESSGAGAGARNAFAALVLVGLTALARYP